MYSLEMILGYSTTVGSGYLRWKIVETIVRGYMCIRAWWAIFVNHSNFYNALMLNEIT